MRNAGSAKKRSITATLIVTYNGDFHPRPLIYAGNTIQSFSRFSFLYSFPFTVNPSHFNSTVESIKIKEEIVAPYVEEQRRSLQLPNQATIIIMNVFQCQMTVEVLDILHAHDIYLCKAPANMTHLLQTLDLMVNNYCKVFMKNKFGKWFGKQVEKSFKLGLKVEESNIQFVLATMTPLQVLWLVEFWYHTKLGSGSSIRTNCWKATGIFDAIMGSAELPSLNLF